MLRNLDATGLALAVAFVFLWNSGFIGAEYGLPYAGAFTVLFWRYAALSLLLLAFLAARGGPLWPGRSEAAHNVLIGMLAHAIWLACVLLSQEQGVPAGVVALVVALQPLMTGALSGRVTGEPVSPRQWLGLAIGFSGVAVAVGARINAPDTAPFAAYALPFGSVAAMTAASLLERRRRRQGAEPPRMDVALFYQSIASAVLLAGPAFLAEGLATRWDPSFLVAQAWLILPVSVGAYAAMWTLIGRWDATRVASLFYIGPPVTMLMAWLAFGDGLRPTDLVGLAIAGCGVLLVQIPVRRLLSTASRAAGPGSPRPNRPAPHSRSRHG